MLSPLRNRFGIPGVISVVALVFAMLGGAYAASNNDNGKATASAKAKRGPKGPKGPTGPAGPAGPAGPQGAAGAKGDAGANGSNGAQGSQGLPGKSVAVANYSGPECAGSEEGATVEVSGEPATKKYVCDGVEGPQGPEGSPWTAGGTLPSGETLMGAWTVGEIPAEGAEAWISISFNIPLASDLAGDKAHFINQAGNEVVLDESTFEAEELASHPSCPGTAVNPAALAGHLCLYAAEESGLKKAGPPAEYGIYGAKPGAAFTSFHNAVTGGLFSFGVSRAGANVLVQAKAPDAFARGTWAVTG